MNKYLLSIGLILSTTACDNSSQQNSKTATIVNDKEEINIPENALKFAKAELMGKNGTETRGSVIFTESYGKVSMIATLTHAKEGSHAIHIHAQGDCNTEDASSAGGHWNPLDSEHGKWDSNNFHRGDIGNILVNQKGEGSISKDTDLWCLGCDSPVKNILGKSIVVHAKADDFNTQPNGAAGIRIACGKIMLTKE